MLLKVLLYVDQALYEKTFLQWGPCADTAYVIWKAFWAIFFLSWIIYDGINARYENAFKLIFL